MLRKIFGIVLIISLFLIYSLLPSVVSNDLMDGTQNAKLVVFLFLILNIGAATSLRIFFSRKESASLNYLDLILLIWVSYVFINIYLKHVSFSPRLLELAGLILLYIALRQIPIKYFSWLFIALILGGAIQAVYGN